MNKVWHSITICLSGFAVTLTCFCTAGYSADDMSLREWQLDEQRFYLRKQLKELQQQNDELERKAFEVKKQLNYLNSELDATYDKLKTTRQKIVIVKDQLR
jgi:peptidoglycan hydrolase CwlO-like protein